MRAITSRTGLQHRRFGQQPQPKLALVLLHSGETPLKTRFGVRALRRNILGPGLALLNRGRGFFLLRRRRRSCFEFAIVVGPQRFIAQSLVSLSDASECRFDSLSQLRLALVKTIRMKAPREQTIGSLDLFSISHTPHVQNLVVILGIGNAREKRIELAGLVCGFAWDTNRFS